MDLPESISLKSKLGIWDQRIEYESIPFACFHCKKAGHWAKKFPSLKGKAKKSKKVWVKKDLSKGARPDVDVYAHSKDQSKCFDGDVVGNVPMEGSSIPSKINAPP